MSGRKTVLGITLLLALVLSAFAASSASAAGVTTFTCVQNANGDRFGPHCLAASTGDNTKYAHQTYGARTTYTTTNANTASGTTAAQSGILKGTISGVNTEVTCASVTGEGEMENKEEGGVMFGHGVGTLNFTGCVVKAPAEKGCKVKGEAVSTNQITEKTVGTGEKMKVTPTNVEEKFATITIEGCSIEALNNSFPVTGSLEAKVNGATLTSTHAEITTQNTLKFGGQKAGLDGAVTKKGHANGTEETKPIVNTPSP